MTTETTQDVLDQVLELIDSAIERVAGDIGAGAEGAEIYLLALGKLHDVGGLMLHAGARPMQGREHAGSPLDWLREAETRLDAIDPADRPVGLGPARVELRWAVDEMATAH
ncbi:hypothetical protein [Arsenicicoccus bolidensis]|uniref:hypothetical protein n=1 Tax=Arsenicicoccus bolidensis TaxID=229480 RepID=UPI0004929A60|nr:hypothetical protein [Arsenicicoccus bolidensis]